MDLANFTYWPRHLLQFVESIWNRLGALWAGRLPEAQLAEVGQATPPAPIATFQDPFLTGKEGSMAPAELVRYSFAALEAWAFERGQQRQIGETPLEFIDRMAADLPALEQAALGLGQLYVGLAYARNPPPPERIESLRKFWLLLHEMAARPMSSGV